MSSAVKSRVVPDAVRLIEPTREADPYRDMDMLRFSTAGSVDDGKSTLIGRLLYDTKSIFADQLEAISAASRRRGEEGVNLALLTDGLRAEREQNITIDVAYRYFATPRRKFIIADTPGHVQYTRNMVTGASTADLAIVLVDARKGVLEQSKRHAFISTLLGIPHLVVAVNKMDLVDYDEDVFNQIVKDFTEFTAKLDVGDVIFIPISALHGDNVVTRSTNMPWYEGSTLLHYLETVNVAADRNLLDFRFPVQTVIRPHQDFRGFAGRIVSGTIRAGEEVLILPSERTSVVTSVQDANGPMEEAVAGDCVVITLADEIDISRGDMIVRRRNLPIVGNRVDAMMCWMAETPLDPTVSYVLLHTTRTVRAYVDNIVYRIDVDTLHRDTDADTFALNDIGRVELTTSQPIFFDPYSGNTATGSFVLVDPFTNTTVAAGMIRGEVRELPAAERTTSAERQVSPGVVWQDWNIPRVEREARNGHPALVVWLTGLSGSGKSTIARAVEQELFAQNVHTVLLDGDQLRHGLNGDLGFSPADRAENIRRAGEVARLFFEHGSVVICAFVSPYEQDRERVRSLFPEGRFLEIYVHCPLEVCQARDPKGLYGKAERGTVSGMTGIAAPYERPVSPALQIDTSELSVEQAVAAVRDLLRQHGVGGT